MCLHTTHHTHTTHTTPLRYNSTYMHTPLPLSQMCQTQNHTRARTHTHRYNLLGQERQVFVVSGPQRRGNGGNRHHCVDHFAQDGRVNRRPVRPLGALLHNRHNGRPQVGNRKLVVASHLHLLRPQHGGGPRLGFVPGRPSHNGPHLHGHHRREAQKPNQTCQRNLAYLQHGPLHARAHTPSCSHQQPQAAVGKVLPRHNLHGVVFGLAQQHLHQGPRRAQDTQRPHRLVLPNAPVDTQQPGPNAFLVAVPLHRLRGKDAMPTRLQHTRRRHGLQHGQAHQHRCGPRHALHGKLLYQHVRRRRGPRQPKQAHKTLTPRSTNLPQLLGGPHVTGKRAQAHARTHATDPQGEHRQVGQSCHSPGQGLRHTRHRT